MIVKQEIKTEEMKTKFIKINVYVRDLQFFLGKKGR